ncbi:MAG: hypothetical protein OXI88_14625 [Gammaproteobacteria bacterium]|nr:hypothetical protein [Gammaproteobacteria bacterium]
MLDLDTIFRLSSYTGKAGKYFKSGFKIFTKVIAILVILFTILIISNIYWDDIKLQYYKLIWGPELIFDKLSPGMTRSDVFFVMGEPDGCIDDKEACHWALEYSIGDHLYVWFKKDDVSLLSKTFTYNHSLPFNTVEELKTVLGEEDILSISKDYLTRRYTYLEWGITFGFTANNLDEVTVGDVAWRSTIDVSKYVVNGKVICPSENCPWDDEGNLKPEYEGKSYGDFL